MSTSNKLPSADYRLKNINNALYVDGNDDVVMRTGFAGDIVISGNVNIPGVVTVESSPDNPVHNHVTEVGTSGILTTPWLPVSGNVNATITDVISVVVNPAPITGFYSFNNFGIHTNRGWTMDNAEIPMFAVRVKPGSGKSFRLINYDIGNNNANQSTIGYTWYDGASITGPAYSWVEIDSSGIEYAIFSDCYSTNTPNGIAGGTLNHSGIVIGKTTSDMTPEMTDAVFTDGGRTMFCCVHRMDNATKLDVWFGVTMVTV